MRGVIDARCSELRRFILTDSSSPALLQQASDSLAGRIAIVEICTLKINEIQQQALPEFYSLFEQEVNHASLAQLKKLQPAIKDVISLFLRDGYPEPVLADDNGKYMLWMENYCQTYINSDIKRLFPKLDSFRYRRFINMLASLSGTTNK